VTSPANGRRVALAAALLAALLTGCGDPAAMMQQPANVGDAKLAAQEYRESGAYEQNLALVAQEAKEWLAQRAPFVSRPAIVFDIDETVLSNWTVIIANDFGRIIPGPCNTLPAGPCGWAAWDMRGQSTALSPTLDLYRSARANNVAVFFITGRPESQRRPTERNLRAAGFDTFVDLMMPRDGARYASAADFKAPSRAAIERSGYMIIANVGDQPSDLAGGHAERTFLLPNPFYRIP